MARLGLILVFALLGSVGSLLLAAGFLLLSQRVRQGLVPYLVSYATGSLFGAAFLGLLAEALDLAPASRVLPTVLGGLVLFFALEKIIAWRYQDGKELEVHHAAGPLVIAGDGLHNLGDGMVLAASFVASVPLGIVTGIAVLAHEIPQEIGDFAVLLDSGYSRRRALLLNGASSLTALVGAVATYFFVHLVTAALPYLMALAAASFIYIAAAILVPRLHRRGGPQASVAQLALIGLGIGTTVLALFLVAE